MSGRWMEIGAVWLPKKTDSNVVMTGIVDLPVKIEIEPGQTFVVTKRNAQNANEGAPLYDLVLTPPKRDNKPANLDPASDGIPF